jgi:Ca2+-binding EF-hand superfamily protein
MIQSENMIYRYLDDDLDAKEKAQFETELQNSSELRDRLDLIRKNLEEIKLNSRPELDARYFSGLIPRLRKTSDRKYYFRLNPVYSGLAAVVIIFMIFMFSSKEDSVKDYTEFSSSELREISESYSIIDNTNQLPEKKLLELEEQLDSRMMEEIDNDAAADYLSYTDLNSIMNSLPEAEYDRIYNELLNRNL